jgi:hypothetical protein
VKTVKLLIIHVRVRPGFYRDVGAGSASYRANIIFTFYFRLRSLARDQWQPSARPDRAELSPSRVGGPETRTLNFTWPALPGCDRDRPSHGDRDRDSYTQAELNQWIVRVVVESRTP